MKTRKMATAAALAVATTGLACPALAEGGFYIGGGVGEAMLQDSTGNSGGVDFDESDTAWKAFAGYNIDAIPLLKLAVEGGYRDLGGPNGTFGGIPVEYSVTGFDFSVLAGLGLGPVDVMARVGGMQYDLDKRIGGATQSFDGTAPIYGIGAWLTFGKIGVRAEYEFIDIDELDGGAEMISLSAFYKF